MLAHEGDALLLERAEGKTSLADLARNGRDDEASRIICAAVAKLHAPRDRPPPDLIPLAQWFWESEPAAATHGGIFCNPDHQTATAPGRFARQVEVVAEAASLERKRLLQWILAWAGLCAAWFLGDGLPPETDLKVAKLAAAELNR